MKPGLDLGLYVVREIAWAHGGEVTVRSDKEETVFAVRLPRHNVEQRDRAFASPSQRRFRPPLKFFRSSRMTCFGFLSSRKP